jgi:hypothetical protein
LIIIPSALIFAAALARSRLRLTASVVTAAALGQVLIGFLILDELHGTAEWIPIFMSIAVFLGAYAFFETTQSEPRDHTPADRTVEARLAIFGIVVLGLVAYHFLVGGIPLFSSNVEVDRFDFTGSGLFGLPGRMFLFGLPFLVMLATAFAVRHESSLGRVIVAVAWVAYAIAQILAGFKGSLLIVLIVFFLVRASSGRPVHVARLLSPRFVGLGIAAAAIALVIALQYRSLQLSNPAAAAAYLIDRVTVIAASPGYVAMTEFDNNAKPYVIGDTIYLIQKYTGLHISDHPTYPLELIVSARQSNQPLDNSVFLAPSTVGAFPGWFVDIGWLPSLFVMGVLGGGMALASAHAIRTRSTFLAAASTFWVYVLYLYVVNGSPIYWLVNGLAMSVAFAAVWVLAGPIARMTLRLPRTEGHDPQPRPDQAQDTKRGIV